VIHHAAGGVEFGDLGLVGDAGDGFGKMGAVVTGGLEEEGGPGDEEGGGAGGAAVDGDGAAHDDIVAVTPDEALPAKDVDGGDEVVALVCIDVLDVGVDLEAAVHVGEIDAKAMVLGGVWR
jgi:hypothetical protein